MKRPVVRSDRHRLAAPTFSRNSREVISAEARILASFERAIDVGVYEEFAELCGRSLTVLESLVEDVGQR